MLFNTKTALPFLLLLAASPAAAQMRDLETDPGVGTTFDRGLAPLAPTPDHQRRYTECMQLARTEPLKALPLAEKWIGEGGGLGARHCVAIAMFESGKFIQSANQIEAIARDMGQMEAGQAENAAAAQSRALDLKPQDPDLWIDRGLSYAAMKAWPRAISDFDNALKLRAKDVDTLVLLAAAWRNAGNAGRALENAEVALKLAPDHSEALLERGFARLAMGHKAAAAADFNKVIELVPPGSDAARRADAGLHSGDSSAVATPAPAAKDPRKR